MIDYEKSAELNNCTVEELKSRFKRFSNSNKKVIAICDECGLERQLSFQFYSDLCFECSNKDKTYIKNRVNGMLGGKYRMSEKDLYRYYVEKRLTSTEIAEMYGVSSPTIIKWLKECGIEIRNRVERNTGEMNPRYGKVGKRGKDHWNWQGGLSEQNYCYLFNDAFKEKIRKFFNRRCFLCNMDEKENGRKHDVHHVNYDKDCLCNMGCEFVPLCIRCHMKTNHKRKYWEDLIMCYLYPDRIIMIDI